MRTDVQLVNTMMFGINFAIDAGLLLFWIQSVRSRFLPSRARTYMLASAFLMLAYLLLRVYKYRLSLHVLLSRNLIYAYYVPMMFIPALFLMTSLRIRYGEKTGEREFLLLIPSFVLSLLVFTNDLHSLVYIPKVPLSEFVVETGTYSYGPVFYLLYIWMGLAMLAGVFFLVLTAGRKSGRWLLFLLLVLVIWVSMALTTLLVFEKFNTIRPYSTPEIHIFAMLAIYEVCIRNRLIHYNENYAGFFSQLDIPVLVTDRAYIPAYRTSVPVNASEKQLASSIGSHVYLDPDTRLSGIPIRAGYAFWTEDEKELHAENRRLEAANAILSEENDLIAAERSMKEKMAHIEAQNLVYDRIADALYPRQKRIEALLSAAPAGSPEFSSALAECCVLNAYSKRKSNLLLLSKETLSEKNRELFLALQETARFLKCCGVEAAAVGEEYTDFSLAYVHELYDTFELVVEAYLTCLKRLTVSLTDSGIRLAMEAEREVSLPSGPLAIDRQESDDCIFLTIYRKGGAAS